MNLDKMTDDTDDNSLRILFLCGKARMRSPTAADIVAERLAVSTDFAGLSKDADEQLSSEQLEWADIIAVMERRHIARLKQQFAALLKDKKVVCLDIPDRFEYMDPQLVDLIDQRLGRLASLKL